jgi:hypothetical protein
MFISRTLQFRFSSGFEPGAGVRRPCSGEI